MRDTEVLDKVLEALNNEEIIEESEDYSRLNDNFKKKNTNDKFKCIDLDSYEALKYVSKEWRDPGKKRLHYYQSNG